MNGWEFTIGSAIIVGLVGLVYRILNIKVDSKVDKELYLQTIGTIQKSVEGINGTAKELKDIAAHLSDIDNKLDEKFLTIKEHEYLCLINRCKPPGE